MFQQEGIQKQSPGKRNWQVILDHVPCVIKKTLMGFLSTLVLRELIFSVEFCSSKTTLKPNKNAQNLVLWTAGERKCPWLESIEPIKLILTV